MTIKRIKRMTASEFRQALARIELSQRAIARLLEYDARTVGRWALGEVPVPDAVAILLRLMNARKIGADDIIKAKSHLIRSRVRRRDRTDGQNGKDGAGAPSESIIEVDEGLS